jgi:hypothetical protein
MEWAAALLVFNTGTAKADIMYVKKRSLLNRLLRFNS